MFDVVIDNINHRTGGGTKYIPRNDEDYLFNNIREHKYCKDFTSSLNKYVALDNEFS